MKVILIKDVARLGRRNEVKEVPSGHALNFLIPRKLAIIATPESMKRLNEQVSKIEEGKQNLKQSFEDAVAKLHDRTVVYHTEANEQGHLFKGIGADTIAEHLQSEGFAITKSNIVLEHPIKSLGIHAVGLEYGEVKGVCNLEVVKK
jgi:large subunit ribosomal protein L9